MLEKPAYKLAKVAAALRAKIAISEYTSSEWALACQLQITLPDYTLPKVGACHEIFANIFLVFQIGVKSIREQ